jgi:hypothetical protein
LVSQDRRHLFVTSWIHLSDKTIYKLFYAKKVVLVRGILKFEIISNFFSPQNNLKKSPSFVIVIIGTLF